MTSLESRDPEIGRGFRMHARLSKNITKVSKAHIPPAVAIKRRTTLIGKRKKSTNKGTDKQYVAEFSKHSCTTCHI